MKIEVTVCDVDQAMGVPTKPYRITVDGNTVTRDLCDEHAAPIRALIGDEPHLPASTPKQQPSSARDNAAPRRRRAQVVTMEEIEAMKRRSRS